MNILSWIKQNFGNRPPPSITPAPLLETSEQVDPSPYQDSLQLQNVLTIQSPSILIVDSFWFSQLQLFLEGLGPRPPQLDTSKFLTKHKKLKKGLVFSKDFYLIYKPLWDALNPPEAEFIPVELSPKLRKLNVQQLAQECLLLLSINPETTRLNSVDIILPNVIPRNEMQESPTNTKEPLTMDNSQSIQTEEDLKKETSSTKFSSSQQTDSDSSKILISLHLKKGRVGLENPALFCYLNSGLQCLLSITPFVEFMLRLKCMGSIDTKEVSLLIAKLIQSVFSMRSGTVKPAPLWRFIVNYFPENKQHDMPEFIRFIVNQIECELGDANFIQKGLLNGVICSSVICKKCMNTSDTNEVFIDLQIELSESIEKSIELFTQEENLSSGYLCSVCKEATQAAKHLDILKPPSYLILQVKRFKQTPYPHKLTGFTKYQRKMSIRTKHKSADYELCAVGVHIGSINSGHYIAYGKRSKAWYCFDDSLCTRVRLKSVMKQYAYLLVYKLT